jgi:hypothetical protein
MDTNTPNGACEMPAKMPQQAGPKVLPLQPNTSGVNVPAPRDPRIVQE